MRPNQGMLERYVDRSVAILNIKDHCIAARLAPFLYDAQTVIASRHQSGQINGAHLEVLGHRDRFLRNRRVQDSRYDQLLPGLQERSVQIAIRSADRLHQLRRSQV